MLIGAGIGIPFQQNVLARLLGSAEFFAPLTHSAIPTRAASGTTGTFTRATTKTVENNDGYLVTLLAGEIGFPGARRVRNLLTTTSEDFSNAAWSKNALTVVSQSATFNVSNGISADLLYPSSTGASRFFYQASISAGFALTTVQANSIYAKASGVSWIAIRHENAADGSAWCWFNLATGVIGTTEAGITAAIEDCGDGVYRCSIVRSRGATGAGGANAYLVELCDGDNTHTVTANGTDGVLFGGAQLEDVTAQTTQTAGEYVSVGVESAPYYHGSFVDGVKCYATDINGSPIPSSTLLGYQAQGARTNLCLQSNAFTTTWVAVGTPAATQNVVGPNGATSAWTLTDNSAVALEYIRQTSSALTAANYTFSVFIKKTTGEQTAYPVVQVTTGATGALCTVDTTNGVATVWTAYTGLTIVTSSASCVSYNDDYWRVSLVFLGVAATHDLYLFPAFTTNATQSTGVADLAAQASHVFYGAQLELGSFASSYIATTTVAVTRNADVESYSTSGNIAAAAGSVYLEYTPTHSPSGTIALWGTYVDASNYTAILHDATNLIFRKRIAGVNYDATIANAFVSGTTYKACATWGTAGTSITLNGTEGTPHANTTAAQIGSTMQWGADGNSLQQPFAYLRNCRDWLRQLSASERVAVTA